MSAKFLAVFEATGAVVIWGASFVATKFTLQYVSPNTVVWLRFALGLLILGIATVLRRQFIRTDWKMQGYFFLVGLIGIALHQWLQSNGMVTSQATTTAWIVASIPAVTALLGWLVLRESLRLLQISGILLAGLGVLIVVTRGDLSQLMRGRFGAPGDFLILLSSPNWAVFSVLSRYGLKKLPATFMMFFVMLWGWLIYWPLFLSGGGLLEVMHLNWIAWSSILFLGVFSSGLAYIFWFDALKFFPAGQANTFVYIEPVVTALLAFWWLSERMEWAVLLGGSVVLAGVWMVNQK